jgi:hypothetical protein
MRTKLLLGLCAIVGSIFCYHFTQIIIGEISFWKYLMIEFMITLTHVIYNYTKEKALKSQANG